MRTLSATLLAAQRAASHIPYVKVEARNTIGGAVRYDWERLYSGTEPDYFHAVTMPGDGSLIRVRITPPVDSRKLYRQRVASPAPGADFSLWTYCDQYNTVAVTATALGAEVSIFWIKNDSAIYWMKSSNNGVSWGTPELVGYTPTNAINGIAAAYKPNGDIALFYADQAILYVMKYAGGSWSSAVAWGKSTGDLSGVATVYSGDWNLLVTGKDSAGNYKLWSLIYGDGGDVAAGTWSALKELSSAASGGNFQYRRVFMDKPDVYRAFFVEKFTGTESYNRPFWSHSVPGASFLSSLWREPVPFNLSSEYGLAMAHYSDYCWLSAPNGVWRARLTEQTINLTSDILSVRAELVAEKVGRLVIELRNDDGRYAAPGSGSLAVLNIGCQLELSPGYVTTVGNETSPGQTFILEAYEHTSSGGKATFLLHALDAWGAVVRWLARHQFRWNKSTDELCVKDILAFVLARAGIKLEVKSESATITTFYPDFTINPDNGGDTIVHRLLSFVPDVLFVEGNKAYLVNPLTADSSVYSYGTTHAILEGRHRQGAWADNRVEVEGYDAVSASPIIYNAFAWDEINRLYDKLRRVRDINLSTVARAQARGEAYLREAEIQSAGGVIRVPANCGQQLYDVIDITDSRAGLNAQKRRVLAITLIYNSFRGQYEQWLALGAV